jgi:hypothetical protein
MRTAGIEIPLPLPPDRLGDALAVGVTWCKPRDDSLVGEPADNSVFEAPIVLLVDSDAMTISCCLESGTDRHD